ncbi:MAG: carboxylating nicotinate-nucleotide diphosphorylase, partial [Actinobacteria bacterium]|nr:carboxylating nicotinate-nucleotide diphosphorylase [Actinomycetota bacterium]
MIEEALAEDLDDGVDLTSMAVIQEGATSIANLVARVRGVIAGIEVAAAVFRRVDDQVGFERRVLDGAGVEPGDLVAVTRGSTRSILLAERAALNLLGRMSGVATATRALVDAVSGTRAQITDTRKTMPGLRALDKYAVLVGGGVNHRLGLYDAVLIKDNHITATGDLATAVAAAREMYGSATMIEVEVDGLDLLAQVLETSADRVLLDNMDPETLKRAVEMAAGRVVTEASGGVTLDTVRVIAETGVDFIAVGWIT